MTHEDSKLAASPWHHSTGNIYDDQEPTARLQPFHQSMDHLHVDQYSTTHVLPWHLSTGELKFRDALITGFLANFHFFQSSVPLETREHAWLVKGAAGSWTDIYALFREDSSLLNRHDFISGFTVLHWIAKHGDHRLNHQFFEKSGLTFDINARSTCGHTPLHIAAIHGNKNIMRLLVAKFNADVKLRDIAGKKPWQYLSPTIPPDMFELLGAPARAALGEVGTRRRLRHNISSASSGQRPLTVAGTTKVKRSSSIAAFLKHKSLQLQAFQGHQSDSSV
uniref:Uncharacterized protein n=1 Tax=Monopterus albus TaxID=43700 RepID=A0A3Q3ICC0_MONAL